MKTPARPLNVLYFTRSHERGGAEQHLISLIRALDRGGFHPLLACPGPLAGQIRADLAGTAEIVPIEWRNGWDCRSAARLWRLLRLRKIDILHSHLASSSRLASPIGRFARVPAILETPHVNEKWRRGWLKGNFAADRLAARCVDAFIAVSQANGRYLREQKRLPAEKIHVIPNGADAAKFRASGSRSLQLREQLGFAPGDFMLVSVARLEPQKGHGVLLDAMTKVRAQDFRARLVLVGDGSLRLPLEQRAQRLGLNDVVRFVGWQANVADWLALAQGVVLASFYEGLPLAALEALAAEKPVVATAVDGTPEVVIDGVTGFSVPPGDPDALAAAIIGMLRHPQAARQMAKAGAQLVRERFSLEMQVRSTERLYREIWLRRTSRIPSVRAGIAAEEAWRNGAL